METCVPAVLRHLRTLVIVGLAVSPFRLYAQSLSECVGETDNALRLACYDRLYRAGEGSPVVPAAPISGNGSLPVRPVESGDTPQAPVSSPMSEFWELGPADKRGTFIVRTNLPNFLLPLHYTSFLNQQPSSPTQPAGIRNSNYRKIETKFQISLRAKAVEGLLLPDADLWLAYTQRSLWQVWNRHDSAPFRSTDYQPEAIYVVPVPAQFEALPYDWHWRFGQIGLAHQSNGQSDPLSRSWNRIYLGGILERGDFALQLRANRRFTSANDDDNPDLTHFIGNIETTATWAPGLSTLRLNWRSDALSYRRGSLQLDWTYPVVRAQPAGLRWYVQLFSGYGETLLDYNIRQTSFGAGVSLFQF